MNVLISGGTGVIGEGLIPALKLAGVERIRVLSRHALDDVAQWEDVEPYPADITVPAEVGESAEDFDVVVHVSGIEQETSETSLDDVNVRGTELMVSECERAGVRKLIFVSTLKTETPATDYQRSKSRAEDIVRGFSRDWIILRPSAVYGPGDEHVSVLLQMIRTLPAIPVIDDGQQCIQPVWFEDFASAIVRAIQMDELTHQTLDLGGHRTTVMSLIEHLMDVTGKRPQIVRVPASVALTGAAIAEELGFDLPVNETQLRLVLQESCIEAPRSNALIGTFGIEPFDLRESLNHLADSLPEQRTGEGFGELRRRIFTAEIEGTSLSAEALSKLLRDELTSLMPIPFGVEPGSETPVELGATLTAGLGLRGTIQLRVEELEPRKLTLVTVAGHPLAAIVRFITEPRADAVLLRIEVYARAANLPHWLAMKAGSDQLQSGMWEEMIRNVIERTGGRVRDGIDANEETLDDVRGILVDEWVDRIVDTRRRETGR